MAAFSSQGTAAKELTPGRPGSGSEQENSPGLIILMLKKGTGTSRGLFSSRSRVFSSEPVPFFNGLQGPGLLKKACARRRGVSSKETNRERAKDQGVRAHPTARPPRGPRQDLSDAAARPAIVGWDPHSTGGMMRGQWDFRSCACGFRASCPSPIPQASCCRPRLRMGCGRWLRFAARAGP